MRTSGAAPRSAASMVSLSYEELSERKRIRTMERRPGSVCATSLQRPVGVVCEGYVCLRTARRRHVSLIRRQIHLARSSSTQRRRKPQPSALCTPLGVQSTDSAPGGPPQVCTREAKPETRPHQDEPPNL